MKKLITLFALVLILTSTTPVLAVTATNATGAKTTTVCIDLTEDLSIADKGTKVSSVLKLQSFLYPQYLTEPPTGYFGVLTDAAVKKLQAEYSDEIATPTGYVGPLTRNIIKELTCGGNSQTSAGTKTGETVARTPASTGSSYNSNTGWWLDPAATGVGSTGSTDPIKTTNSGNNITPTSTTTPPTDCDKYAGVIPGESRKLTVEQKPITTYKPSGSMSAEGLRDLALMQGDIGFAMGVGPNGQGGWDRTRIPSGTVFSYKFKTTEYNYPPFYTLRSYYNPETLVGVMGYSISECPADFTSPKVLDQKSGIDVTNKFGDGKGRNCVSYGPPVGSGIQFGVGGVYSDSRCDLDPNKTYYLNITAGFATDLDRGNFPYPHMSTYGYDGGAGRTEMVVDLEMIAQGHMEADRQVWGSGVPNVLWTTEIIKNRSAYYAEAQRLQRLEAEASQRRIEACRAAIAAGRKCSLR